MPTVLKHEVESLDSIPEGLQSLYTANEGGNGFAIPEALRGAADAVTALYTANDKIRTENKQLQRKGEVDLSALSDYGTTVAEIAEAVGLKVKDLEDAVAAGDDGKQTALEKMRTEMKAAHQKELDAVNGKVDGMRTALHSHLVTAAASTALSAENGMVELALPFVEKSVKVIEVDGEYHPRVIDKDGDVRISGATGEPMSIAELVKEMKGTETYQPLFKSEAKPGGGAKPGATGRPPQGGTDQRSALQKITDGLSA